MPGWAGIAIRALSWKSGNSLWSQSLLQPGIVPVPAQPWSRGAPAQHQHPNPAGTAQYPSPNPEPAQNHPELPLRDPGEQGQLAVCPSPCCLQPVPVWAAIYRNGDKRLAQVLLRGQVKNPGAHQGSELTLQCAARGRAGISISDTHQGRQLCWLLSLPKICH